VSIFLYRPAPAAAPDGGGGTGVTAHGALTGLTVDDHTQYARVDGSRRFAVDHGATSGLADDDHTLYARADGTRPFTGPVTVNGDTVWHAGNDGADSGLDADFLDGQQGSYYTGLAGHAHYAMLSGGVTAATPLADYPTSGPQTGLFYATAVTADGWPVQGTAFTVKRSDNYGYQEVVERITLASGTPRRYYRATNSTGVWQAFIELGPPPAFGGVASAHSLPGDTRSNGSATTVARSDHRHGREFAPSVAQSVESALITTGVAEGPRNLVNLGTATQYVGRPVLVYATCSFGWYNTANSGATIIAQISFDGGATWSNSGTFNEPRVHVSTTSTHRGQATSTLAVSATPTGQVQVRMNVTDLTTPASTWIEPGTGTHAIAIAA
jgi:hypothetical protein